MKIVEPDRKYWHSNQIIQRGVSNFLMTLWGVKCLVDFCLIGVQFLQFLKTNRLKNRNENRSKKRLLFLFNPDFWTSVTSAILMLKNSYYHAWNPYEILHWISYKKCRIRKKVRANVPSPAWPVHLELLAEVTCYMIEKCQNPSLQTLNKYMYQKYWQSVFP